jgi:hypothetical protein
MKNMKRYITVRDWTGRKVFKRMVNQDEIINYLLIFPGKTESQIMYDIYGFVRGGLYSNKKYADCLRRALRSGKITRELAQTESGKRYIYFVGTK